MKSYFKYSILFISLFMTLLSCDNYLDREPISDYLSGNFYDNEEALKLGTNGCYQQVYLDVSQASLPYIELFDHYTPYAIERAENTSVGAGGAFATAGGWESLWAISYDGISRCNTVLDGAKPYMDKHSVNTNSMQYLAEVKVLRAYFYYMLVNLFGDVPLMTTAYIPKEQWLEIKREKVSTIIAMMNEDLEDAAKYLPWKFTKVEDYGRCDKTFAYGLKARFALNAGSINLDGNGEQYFRDAATAAKKIIDESNRDLANNFEDLFNNQGQAKEDVKNEIIFPLIYASMGVGANDPKKFHYLAYGAGSRNVSQSGRFPTQLLVDTYETLNGKRIDESGSGYDPQKPYENRDPRLKYTIYTHGDIMIGNVSGAKIKFKVELFNKNTDFWDYTAETAGWVSKQNKDRDGGLQQYAFAESGVGYMWKKYNNFDDESFHLATNDIIVMRMAEIYLTYAEAKIELNEIDGTVYAAIDKVRSRQGVGMPGILVADPSRANNQVKMRQIVRRERKVEFAREGLLFFDMRRWKIGKLLNAYGDDNTVRPTYGFPFASTADAPAVIEAAKKNLGLDNNPFGRLAPTMVPKFGTPNSQEDLNDIADYRAYKDVLRVRDAERKWDDAFYLSPIPRTERNKAPQITNNPGYGD